MRIGIDGKWLDRGPPSGRAMYAGLLPALAAIAGSHELVVFVDRRARVDPALGRAVEVRRVWAGNNLLANLLVLPGAARRAGVDVLACQTFTAPGGPAPRLTIVTDAIYADRPEVFTAAERAYFTMVRPLARHARRVVTLSEAERARLVRIGYPADCVGVMPLGVDGRFRPAAAHEPAALERVRARFHLPPQFLLYVGRLNARKNLGALAAALETLPDAPPLVAAGEPDWKRDRDPALARLAAAGRLLAIGAVNDEDLPPLMASATAFCFPSVDEGFGLPPLEALASGVPVIVSDIPVLRELCGDAARYAAPTASGLAGAIVAVTSDAGAAATMAAAGVARAAEFTWERAAHALLRELELAAGRAA